MAKTWLRAICGVALGGFILTLSTPTHADVENQTPYDFWVKPENGVTPVYVQRGQRYKGTQDGIAVPSRFPNKVFKVVNGCDVILKEDDIGYKCHRYHQRKIQEILGGWKDAKWIDEHSDWKPLFDHSR